MTQKTPTLPPFLVIPGISSQLPRELRESLAELNEEVAVIEKARGAYDDLKRELKAKRAELEARRDEIMKTGGASAAAARMGLTAPMADSPAGCADGKRMAAQLENEIEGLQSAVDAAPEVFEIARERLQIAEGQLKDHFREFKDHVTFWADAAKRAMETATIQIDNFISIADLNERNSLARAPEHQFAEGHPLVLISGLLECSRAYTKALKSAAPLVQPPPAPVEAREHGFRAEHVNMAEWHRERDARIAAEEKQAAQSGRKFSP